MGPFDDGHYVPILLTKQGERDALRDSTSEVKAAITPLFVVAPIDWDYDIGAPKKTVDDHLAKLPSQLVSSWGDAPAFLDTHFLDDTLLVTGEHPLEWIIAQARSLGLTLTPTVSPDRSGAYVDAVHRVVSSDGNGVCLRLPVLEWPATRGYGRIDELLDYFAIDASEVDLVLDLSDETGPAALAAVLSELRSLRDLHDWRSITVAGAAMPQTMPTGSGLHVIDREDWWLHRAVRTSAQAPLRLPTFGDYGIGHPDPVSEIDPKLMSISATLRYTSGDSWLIAKGGLYKGSGGRSLGGEAVPPMCDHLVAHPGFMAGHCGTDVWVTDARGGVSPGNPTIWRREATRHHLQLVTEQIASLVSP